MSAAALKKALQKLREDQRLKEQAAALGTVQQPAVCDSQAPGSQQVGKCVSKTDTLDAPAYFGVLDVIVSV
jgi:hypothetical protein